VRTLAAASAGAVLALALAGAPRAGDRDFVVPARTDKCPVCGMFVARYPDWIAGVRFRDGGYAVFDGAKDLVKFWLDVGRYAPARSRDDVVQLFVTDYYAVRQVDARAAWFVLGSDVLGPMGHEAVPFASEADARGFLADHHGRRVLRLSEIDAAVLGELE
jgi:nitrous oxide reductase accessory protein NosL